MCFGSPKMPDPLPPPQLAKVAEVEEGTGLKGAAAKRAELLIRKRSTKTGAAGSSNVV